MAEAPPITDVKSNASKPGEANEPANTPPISLKIQKSKIVSKLKATAPEFVPGSPLESLGVKDKPKPGKPTQLLTNHYNFVFNAPAVFLYAVSLDSDVGLNINLGAFAHKLRELFGAYAFDGTNILAIKKLDKDATTLKQDKCTITLKLIKEVSTKRNQETLGLINVMLKRLMRAANLVQLGRDFFWPKPKDVQGLQLFEGLVNAITPCQLGWHLVVDKVHRVIHRETIRDIMTRILEEQDAKALHQELQGSMVFAANNKRLWRIDGFDMSKTLDDEFELKDGTKTSFRKYYAEQYGIKLESKDPGLIVCLPRGSSKKSLKQQPIFLVPELCHLTGVTDAMRSNWKLNKALADTTRMPPSERVKSVQQLIQTVLGSPQVAEEMKKLQIEIKLEPTTVQARVLGPFNVMFNHKKSVPTKYCVMYDKKDHDLVDRFMTQVIKLASTQGGAWPEPTWVPIESGLPKTKIERWTQGITQVKKENPILSSRSFPLATVTCTTCASTTSVRHRASSPNV